MKTLLVSLPPEAADGRYATQLRHLSQDIAKRFEFSGYVELPENQNVVNDLHVVVHSTRHLGTVNSYVKKAIQRFGFTDIAYVSRVDDWHPPEASGTAA